MTLSLPVSEMMSLAASEAFFSSQQAKITLAPLLAKSSAVSFPIPLFEPVIMAVFPKKIKKALV